jgi:dTDP-4-dehydrorhamnose 3,5-epimerase
VKNRFTVTELPLKGLRLIERQCVADQRGFLSRIFCAEEFAAAHSALAISQINHTRTNRRGAVRGLHFQQPPFAEVKLVTCIRGRVWDVAVDVRAGSVTLLRWHAELLSADNLRALMIPAGFAHGFQALTDECELLYLHSAPYVREAESGLNPRDPMLSIGWPLEITDLSSRDAAHEFLRGDFPGVML